MYIDELIKIPVNGMEQWIYIRGGKKDNPILFFLHGGPGFPGIAASSAYQRKLEENFTVIQWDQRFAGKTFVISQIKQPLTVDLYISDLFQLLDYIENRFDRKKVYLAGHSWGSLMGMLAIKQAPQRFISYIGIGQFVNLKRNSEECYNFCYQKAKENNNAGLVKAIEKLGIADDCAKWDLEHQYAAMLGSALYNQTGLEPLGKLFFSTELYTDTEKQNIPQAMFYSCIELYSEMAKYNLLTHITSVDIPIMFLSGEYDRLASVSLVKEYFNILSAPEKRLEIFDKSAHFPFIEETDKFTETVCEWLV